MLRLMVTLAVGFGLLVGVGAFFDPEGAREAIRRDMAGFADVAARQAGEAVRDAVERVAETATAGPPTAPEAGPRPEKKRPPVVAGPPAPKPESPEDVEEIEVVARSGFVEAPLPEAQPRPKVTSAGSASRVAEPAAGGAASDAPSAREPEAVPPDVGEQGVLIRRMLALYERVTERR